MKGLLLTLVLFLTGCASTPVPPIPEPGYQWHRHLAVMTYERAGHILRNQEMVDINLLDDDTRDGGLLLASQEKELPHGILITATKTFYRMQGTLLPDGGSRVFEGRAATAPPALRGWVGLQQYLQAHPQLGEEAAYSYAPTKEHWKFQFLHFQVYDEAVSKPR